MHSDQPPINQQQSHRHIARPIARRHLLGKQRHHHARRHRPKDPFRVLSCPHPDPRRSRAIRALSALQSHLRSRASDRADHQQFCGSPAVQFHHNDDPDRHHEKIKKLDTHGIPVCPHDQTDHLPVFQCRTLRRGGGGRSTKLKIFPK